MLVGRFIIGKCLIFKKHIFFLLKQTEKVLYTVQFNVNVQYTVRTFYGEFTKLYVT